MLTNVESLTVMLLAELESDLSIDGKISSRSVVLMNDMRRLLDTESKMFHTEMEKMYKQSNKLFTEVKSETGNRNS